MCEERGFAFKSSLSIIVYVDINEFQILHLITNFKLVIIFTFLEKLLI